MSCIRFSTSAQRAQFARMAPRLPGTTEAGERHTVPPATASKIRRLRVLAADPNPKIRESAASSRSIPPDVAAELASDPDEGVRSWLARNETIPTGVLRALARDASATVRGWVALNSEVPADVLSELGADRDATVRALVAWRAAHQAESLAV